METISKREVWNKGKLEGQKPPLKPKDIWAIRIHLKNHNAVRDLAVFNLAIDSKLRGCDLVNLRVRDICHDFRRNVPFVRTGARTQNRSPETARGRGATNAR